MALTCAWAMLGRVGGCVCACARVCVRAHVPENPLGEVWQMQVPGLHTEQIQQLLGGPRNLHLKKIDSFSSKKIMKTQSERVRRTEGYTVKNEFKGSYWGVSSF